MRRHMSMDITLKVCERDIVRLSVCVRVWENYRADCGCLPALE